MQSGMYLDYIVKKLGEILVKNLLCSTSIFFGEKFIVEFLSKKTIDRGVNFLNLWVLNRGYELSNFYNGLVFFFMGLVLLVEFILLVW